jgi:ATP adenylyltransferase
MDRIWAPWRMDYIENRGERPGCLFCDRLAQEDGVGNLILHRGGRAFVMLNRYPYSSGHMMVVPIAHRPSIEDLDDDSMRELMQLSSRAVSLLRKAYGAQAFNLGINIGAPAGAGVVDHVHIHVLPRWSGDTNFMVTTAETRVIPEALADTYLRLRSLWSAAAPDPRP